MARMIVCDGKHVNPVDATVTISRHDSKPGTENDWCRDHAINVISDIMTPVNFTPFTVKPVRAS